MAKSKGRTIQVDGSKMQGEGSIRVPENDYKATITQIEQTTTKDDDRAMLVLHYKIADGKHKGKTIKDRIVLKASSDKKDTIWKLRQVLEAMGKKVPTKLFSLNLDKLIGPEVAITVVDGKPWNNKIKSEIADVQSVDILDEEDDDEDEDSDDDDDDDLEEVDLDDEL